MKRFLLATFLSLSVFCVLAAEDAVSIRGVRPLAMGDAFTGVSDDQNAFFYNPAGSVQRTGDVS